MRGSSDLRDDKDDVSVEPSSQDDTGNLSASGDDEEPKRFGRTGSLVVVGCVALLGVFAIVLAAQAGVGTPSSPGPGLWPLAAAVLMTSAATATVVQTALGARAATLHGSAKPFAGLALAVLFVLMFSFVGVVGALLALFVLWTRLLGGMGWLAVITWSVLGTLALYLLFGVVIETPFPAPLTPVP